MTSPSRKLLHAALATAALLTAGPLRAQESRAVPKPAPSRQLPPGAAVVIQHGGTGRDELQDPDPRIGTYVSSSFSFNTSSYWIEGPEGLILIDTQLLPSAAGEFVDWAEKLTGKKAVLAIVLNANPERFNGTAVLKKRGIKVVTSEQVRKAIPAAHEKRLATLIEHDKVDYPKTAEEVLPESFGDKDTELTAGGLTVRAFVLGPGSSEAHVVVGFDGHAFVGDLVANGSHGVLELGKAPEWVERMKDLRAMKAAYIHPGRGPSGDARLLQRQIDYLKTFMDEVAAERKRAGAHPHPKSYDRVRAQLLDRYVGYQYPVFLEHGILAEWARQVAESEAQGKKK